MKLRIVSLLLVLVLLSGLMISFASADNYTGTAGTMVWDAAAQAYLYGEDHYGIVICTRLTVRDRASTGGASLAKLKNGQPVKILGVTADSSFYLLDPESCGISDTTRYPYGYVKTELVKIDPYFIATTRLTNLYATPWSTALKNGEQNNRFFLVIDQYNDWYAVQNAESTPGTAFIRTRDVGQYNKEYKNLQVITWDAAVYDEMSWKQVNTVKRFTVGNVLDSNGAYSLFVFNEGTASEFRGWVSAQYAAPLIN